MNSSVPNAKSQLIALLPSIPTIRCSARIVESRWPRCLAVRELSSRGMDGLAKANEQTAPQPCIYPSNDGLGL